MALDKEGKIIEVLNPSEDVCMVRFEPPVSCKPGQFISVLREEMGKPIRKPYSIASTVDEHTYSELCVRIVPGEFSTWICSHKPGDLLRFKGPFGGFILQDQADNDLVFAATGTGISSIRPMVFLALKRWGVREKGEPGGIIVRLFFGVRTWDGLLYKEDWERLTREYANFRFIPCLSREARDGAYRGYVQNALLETPEGFKGEDIYICGVEKMVQETVEAAKKMGFPKEKIHFEEYV